MAVSHLLMILKVLPHAQEILATQLLPLVSNGALAERLRTDLVIKTTDECILV